MRKLITLACMASLAQPALSQSSLGPLRIVIEDLSQDADQCGFSKTSILSATRAAMRYNRIEEIRNATVMDPEVYVNVNNIVLSGSSCATSVEVTIRSRDIASPPGLGPHVILIEYCEAGGMLTGPNQSQRVTDYVKMLFDNCLSDMANAAMD